MQQTQQDASPLLRINDVDLKKLAADSEADGSSLDDKTRCYC